MIKPSYLCMLLFAISFIPRFFPFLLGKQLKKSIYLNNLARSLPPCIMLLLVAHALKQGNILSHPEGISQLSGITAIIISHFVFRKALISMALGFIVYQFCLFIF